jgi:thioredoxin reductase
VLDAYDAVIIGGGPAGLAAALVLARARRSTLLLDDDAPRNAAASRLHGFVTRDGTSAHEFRHEAHRQLQQYPLFELRRARAERVVGSTDAFEVQLSDGQVAAGRRLLLCTGLKDELPPLPGLAEVWGKSAFDCPYCHGWEAQDKVLGYLAQGGDCLQFSLLLQSWSNRIVVFTDERTPERGLEDGLAKAGTVLEKRQLTRVVPGADGWLEGIEVAGGAIVPCQALFLRPPQRHAELVRRLRLELDRDGMVRVNSDMETSLDGVSAAGDLCSVTHGALVAAASGSIAAHALHRALVLGK